MEKDKAAREDPKAQMTGEWVISRKILRFKILIFSAKGCMKEIEA